MEREQHLAALASVALLITMFFPWYGLQSLNRKTEAISSHTISAFGDVSFVEAAVFLVAVGVGMLLFSRAEGRDFNMPGGDGTIVMLAGAWAGLLIFYRVFSRPPGDGYPVGIEWGFFLAFMAAGGLTYAGWRMRSVDRPPVGASRPRPRRTQPSGDQPPRSPMDAAALVPAAPRTRPPRSAPVPADRGSRDRPSYPPAPPLAPSPPAEQLSFEDSPPGTERRSGRREG
jgi:hypothetical protein